MLIVKMENIKGLTDFLALHKIPFVKHGKILSATFKNPEQVFAVGWLFGLWYKSNK